MTRKMKDSGVEWIGEIPEDWEVTKLKQLASFHNGDRGKNYPSGNDLVDEGVYFLTSNNIHGYYLDIGKSISKFITNERLNVLNGAKIQINDIVFCLRGSVGNCSINKSLEKGTIASSLMLIRPINIDADFLNYIMQSDIKVMEVLNLTTGSCAANLSAINVSNFKILQPSLSEQMKISNYLNKKTERIEDIKSTIVKQIQTLENYKKSVITEAVTKGLDKNVEMKDSGIEWIGEIPKHWEVKRLKQILSNDPDSLKVGPFGSALKSSDLVNNGKWVYNQRTVIDNNFSSNDTFIDDKKFAELRGFKVQAGDILLTTRGTIGKIAIVPSVFYEGVIHPCIIKFNLNKKIFENELIRFIFNHTDLVLKQVEFLSNSTTIGVIYSYNLVNIYIPTPPIGEQSQIIDYLDKKTKLIDDSIAIKQKQLETLEEYKKSLIYEYVTGKKEVNDGEET